MIDDFHGDAAGLGFIEGAGDVAMQRGPGFFVDFGFQRGFERAVRIVRAEEAGVAHEEAFFVVVSVNKPAGNALWTIASHFTGLRVEDIHAIHFYP